MNGVRKPLDRDQVKLIAVFTMTLNHAAHIFLEQGTALYSILVYAGYFTAPVMCFFLVEGFRCTRSKKRYALRLLLFALLSQIPFCMAFPEISLRTVRWGAQGEILLPVRLNFLFTLLICFGILTVREQIRDQAVRFLLICGLFLISMVSDWALLAPAFTLLFARAGTDRGKAGKAFLAGAAFTGFLEFRPELTGTAAWPERLAPVLAVCGVLAAGAVVVLFYHGRQRERRRISRWFFYLYYPAHLLVLVFCAAV